MSDSRKGLGTTVIAELVREYRAKRDEIRTRLKEFEEKLREPEEELFAELCFCLFTPQSRALVCDRAILALRECGLLTDGSEGEVALKMEGVRYRDQKACYLVLAREKLIESGQSLKERVLTAQSNTKLREWLVKNVKGLGYKEASHFLRNIGMGHGLAILDRHVLKNLLACGVIDSVPKTLGRRKYFEIEERMRSFSSRIGISMEEMDLLFWSRETGRIFK
jgi:N-glycosylase/DNA lyase